MVFKFQTTFSFANNQNQKRRSNIKFADEIALHMQKGTKETAEFEKIMAECAAVMGPINAQGSKPRGTVYEVLAKQ